MRIFTNYRELNSANNDGSFLFKPEFMPAGFQCCDCGAVRLFQLCGSIGYATVDGNQMLCYECADIRQIAMLKNRSLPFTAYLSNKGDKATSWTGGKLGDVYQRTSARIGWNGGYVYRFHVRDVHGQWWQARGAGFGMCCTLRPMKTPAYAKNLNWR